MTKKKARRVVLGEGVSFGGELYRRIHKDHAWFGGFYFSTKDLVAVKWSKIEGKRVRLIAEILQ